MKRFLIVLIFQFVAFNSFAQYVVTGGVGTPYEYSAIAGSHVQGVYLLNTLANASITYTSNSTNVIFYKYQTSFASKQLVSSSDVTTTISGGITSYHITNLLDGWGYLADDNNQFLDAVWIVDYSLHLPQLNSLTVVESVDKCTNLKLLFNKSDDLYYYGENGLKQSVERIYTLEYTTDVWDQSNYTFSNKMIQEPAAYGPEIVIPAPYLDTQFEIKGDQFADHFGLTRSVASAPYTAVATQAHIEAVQTMESGVPTDSATTLGGSAPVEINFYGHGNEPVANYYTWFIYKLPDMDNAIVRYTDKDIKYTFNDAGDYKVVLEVADRSSVCADTTSVALNISISSLDQPNYFSPGADRVWRVSYKSLVKFHCTIVNRWGNILYEFDDPSKGWDGKYKGSYVNTGVYFYVIQAEGSDGIVYKKGGDINVLRTR